jgi:[ribosomal protein S5]-alanine N-acetyltransferase
MSVHNFDPFPELETKHFRLRRLTEQDKYDIFSFRSDAEVMRFIPRPAAQSPEDVLPVLEMINNGINSGSSINWGICNKEDNKVIGIIGFVKINTVNQRAEVGYVLHRSHHRKGIIHETLNSIIDFGFETMKLNAIEAIVDPENIPSFALLEKNNFKREGLLRDNNFHDGKYSDTYIYSLLKRERD